MSRTAFRSAIDNRVVAPSAHSPSSARMSRRNASGAGAKPSADWLPSGTVPDSLKAFQAALQGSGVEVRMADWYAARLLAKK